MTFDDLKAFIGKEDKRLGDLYGDLDVRTKILARAAKLTEEIGELNDALLSSLKFQRPEKLARFAKEELEDEFVDTLLCVLLLAKSADVDVDKILDRKIGEIEKRAY